LLVIAETPKFHPSLVIASVKESLLLLSPLPESPKILIKVILPSSMATSASFPL